jgi:hypothetical protein
MPMSYFVSALIKLADNCEHSLLVDEETARRRDEVIQAHGEHAAKASFDNEAWQP